MGIFRFLYCERVWEGGAGLIVIKTCTVKVVIQLESQDVIIIHKMSDDHVNNKEGIKLKLTYFTYCFERFDDRTQFRASIKAFIKASTSQEALPLAKQNRYGGENLYLLPVLGDFYLFVQTKDREIIKKIEKNSSEIKAHEIQTLLTKDESLGFASYVYFHPSKEVFGFAARVLSPKVTAFQVFVNNFFRMLKIDDISFLIHPLKTKITKKEAMNLDFIGTTRIQIDANSEIGNDFKSFFFGSANQNDMEIIDSVEIIIKPAPRKALTDTVKHKIMNMDDKGVKGIVLRAKQNLNDNIKDFYIHNSGGLYDEIDNSEESKILEEIKDKIEANSELEAKVEEYEDKIPELSDSRIHSFGNANNWRNH